MILFLVLWTANAYRSVCSGAADMFSLGVAISSAPKKH